MSITFKDTGSKLRKEYIRGRERYDTNIDKGFEQYMDTHCANYIHAFAVSVTISKYTQVYETDTIFFLWSHVSSTYHGKGSSIRVRILTIQFT